MPHSKEKQQQFNDYNTAHYDVISARFSKDDKFREQIHEAAAKSGVNINGFIKCALQKAVKEVLHNDNRSFMEYLEEQKPVLEFARHKPKKRSSVLGAIKDIKAEQSKAQQDIPKLERKKARSNENEI